MRTSSPTSEPDSSSTDSSGSVSENPGSFFWRTSFDAGTEGRTKNGSDTRPVTRKESVGRRDWSRADAKLSSMVESVSGVPSRSDRSLVSATDDGVPVGSGMIRSTAGVATVRERMSSLRSALRSLAAT